MFRKDLQLIDGKRYVVIRFNVFNQWDVISETDKGVTKGEAIEILQYWTKYKKLNPREIVVTEVPDIR